MLEVFPILKSLWRSKTGPILIIIQLALTIVIISNGMFIIQQRSLLISRSTGMQENNLFSLFIKVRKPEDKLEHIIERDMKVIRSIAGVINATPSDTIPLSNGGQSSGYKLKSADDSPIVSANGFKISEAGLDTLGLTLIEGRNFWPEDIVYRASDAPPASDIAIVTRKFAEQILPGHSVLGENIYIGEQPLTIVGIVDHMIGAFPHWEYGENVILLPSIVDLGSINYLVRTVPGERDQIMLAVVNKLKEIDNSRLVVNPRSIQDYKDEVYEGDTAMIKFLSVVMVLLVFINVLGIIGLTTFWVNQRRKQIGIRRALGASKIAITRYFIVENILLCLAAVFVGTVLAILSGDYMVRHYSLPMLPWYYVLATASILLLLTLLAASIPALRAAQVSPAVATASV